VPSSTERGAASRASKRLDRFSAAMCAIANQRVDLIIGVAKVEARSVGTGEALGVHALGSSPPAFDLVPRAHRWMRRPHNRRESGDVGAGFVWPQLSTGQDHDGTSKGNKAALK
jgi:hypothetical protein